MQFIKICILTVTLLISLTTAAEPTYESIYQLDINVARTGGGLLHLGNDGRAYGVSNNPVLVWSVNISDGSDFQILDNDNNINVNSATSFATNSQGLFFKGAYPNDSDDEFQTSRCPLWFNYRDDNDELQTEIRYGLIYRFNGDTQPTPVTISQSVPICPTRQVVVDDDDNIYFYSAMDSNADDEYLGDKLYKISSDLNSIELIYSFTEAGDSTINPTSLLLSNDGEWLYGVNVYGGSNDSGFIFSIRPDGTDYSVIYNIDPDVGGLVTGGLTSITEYDDYLYLVLYSGGEDDAGVILRMQPDGTSYQKLYEFIRDTSDYSTSTGGRPNMPLAIGGDGYIYGTTSRGGAVDKGTIYRIKPDEITDSNSGFELLYSFTGDAEIDGQLPTGLYTSANGKLYGVVANGNGGRLYALDTGYTPQGPVFNAFYADPTEIEWIGSAQETVTLSWNVTNAVSCEASGAWSDSKDISGSEIVTPVQVGDNIYTLTCDSGSGLDDATSSQSITVKAVEPSADITLSFTSSVDTLVMGDSLTLNWSANNAISCYASGDWSGSLETSGSDTLIPDVGSKAYTIACTGEGDDNTTSETLSITVKNTGTSIDSDSGSGAFNLWLFLPLGLLMLRRSRRLPWISHDFGLCRFYRVVGTNPHKDVHLPRSKT